jgi:uncharacterized protein YqhQ
MKKGLGVKMKPSGIGGMAVMEGVMMKNKDEYAVAVRKPNNEIVVEKSTYTDFSDKVKLFKLPIFRGMLAFVEVVVVGLKVLNFSTNFFEDEEEIKSKDIKIKGKSKVEKNIPDYDDDFEIDEVIDDSAVEAMVKAEATKEEKLDKKNGKSNAVLTAVAVVLSIALSVALFMVLPVITTNLFSRFIANQYTLAFMEGMLRLVIFIAYVILAAKMPEIKRIFMYHGAEHKTINCLEQGIELTVENVKGQSKQHMCCQTNFMVLVIVISLFFFLLLPVDDMIMRIVSRVLLVPLIAGVSYELIRLAGKSKSGFVHILSLPGLWMQGLTTKEPNDEMIEVAIQSVGAVLDWKVFLVTSPMDDNSGNDNNTKRVTNTYPKEKKSKDTKEKNRKRNVSVKEEPAIKEAAATTEAAYTTEAVVTKEVVATKEASYPNKNNRNQGIAPVPFKPIINDESEEEDDEILKALDKFFDGQKK